MINKTNQLIRVKKDMTNFLEKYPDTHKITCAKVTAPLTLEVCFNDGVIGRIIFPSENLNGLFAHFKAPEYFKKVIIVPPQGGVLTLPNPNPTLGNDPYDPHHVVDFCSDALYFEIMEGNGTFVFGKSSLK